MKKLIFLILLSVTIQFAHAQKVDTLVSSSPQAMHDFYMKKRKANKTAGWILLSSGVAMFVGGSLINFNENFLNSNGDESKGAWLAYVGAASTLVSIPVFIAARKNKLKARLALKGEAVTIGGKMLPKSAYSALAITIQL